MDDPELRLELLQRLFEEAQTLAAAERAAFVERRCGEDAWLKKRLTVMLRAVASEGVAPSSSTRALAANGSASGATLLLGEGPGARIGNYTLVQQIGEGGFGSVFLAEQHHPVVRKVAIKILKLGMDTRQVVARFEQERQALAMMDAPPRFGTSPSGRCGDTTGFVQEPLARLPAPAMPTRRRACT